MLQGLKNIVSIEEETKLTVPQPGYIQGTTHHTTSTTLLLAEVHLFAYYM